MSTNASKIKINLDALKSRREWKRHKVKDGHNVFRVLPPFGESSNGYPYRKWQIIWGLKNPEDGRMRPYASSMTSEKKCPVTEFAKKLKVKSETAKAQLLAAGHSEEDAKTQLDSLNKIINDLTPKTVYVYNAADKSGEVGLLELKSTAHKKMKAEMQQYIQDYNQDPTSLNSEDDDSGVWFDITRSGLGRDTEYDVKKCQLKTKGVNGKLSFEDDRSALPDAVVQNYDNLAYDLGATYQVKSYEELEEILQANLDEIIDACPLADLDTEVTTVKAKPVMVRSAPVKVTPSKVAIKLDSSDDEEEEVVAPVRTAPKTNTAPIVKKSAPVQSFDDDFMAEADALLNS